MYSARGEDRILLGPRLHSCISLLALALGLPACAGEAAEGRPWVHKLTLVGVRHVDKGDLESKIATEQTSWYPFAPKKYLDPFTLELDRKRIASYYRAYGYFRADVVSTEVKPRDQDSVDVKIIVQEGPPTRINNVELTGLEPLGDKGKAIRKHFDLKKGQVFNHEIYLSEKSEVDQRTKALGFHWSKVNGEIDVNRDISTADVYLKLDTGPLTTIGDVKLAGDYPGVAARQVVAHTNLKRGAYVTPDALEQARGKVYNLGIFASVKVEVAPEGGRADVADVILQVHEGPLRELRLGVGFGLEFQRTEVRARAVYTRRNFFGGLRSLRLRLEPAFVAIPAFWNISRKGPAALAEAQFTQPDLFTTFDTLKLTVGYELGIDYAYQYHGPRTQLAYLYPIWRDRLQLSLSYNFQFLMFFNTDPTILEHPEQARRLFGYTDPYRVGWWQQDIALDLRDRPLDAHSGGYLALSAEEGGVYALGAFRYEKLTPDIRGYLPLGERVVVAARAQFGQLWVQGSLGSPITRRFYLGGPDSHRGFNYNRLSLQVPSGIRGVLPFPIGGDQMFLGQGEVRVGIVKLYGFWLEAAGFFDTGDVALPSDMLAARFIAQTCPNSPTPPRSGQVDFGKLHYAVGGGLRYKTIIGTLRVDVGVRLNRLAVCEPDGTPNPDPGDRLAFHVSIGEPF